MNLLITNTREDQAYLILRCLRQHAGRIVVTISGDTALERWGGMSVWSRHARKRYRVPDCAVDWRAGVIQSENTPSEEGFVQRVEEICALERIDCVFPSYDAEVYVFSKNRERLAEQGVTVVVPDYDSVSSILDKSVTLAAAQRAGFPVPRTRVPGNLAELRQAAAEIEPPWMLKPRCNAHAVNIKMARDMEELERAFAQLSARQERPLLQEYIPVATKRNYYILVNRDSEVLSLFTPQVHRIRKAGVRAPCAAVESSHDVPYESELRALLKELGVWGGMTVQSIVDARDGQPKLMEINPRFGHNLWFRTELGINEPLLFLRMVRDEIAGPVPAFDEGVLLLDPLWDLVHLSGQCLDQSLAWLRRRLRGRDPDSAGEPYEAEPLGPFVRDLRKEYFGPGRRITSPLNRGYLSDPLPPLVRFIREFVQALQRRAT